MLSNILGRTWILFLLLLPVMESKGQDTLYLKDSSVIQGLVTKVHFDWIEYLAGDSGHKATKVDARKVALITFAHGGHQVISRRFKLRLNFGLNVQLNKAFSNWPYRHPSPGQFYSMNYDQYQPVGTGKNYLTGGNLGINVLGGRRENFAFLFSGNYTLSRSEYIKEIYRTEYTFPSNVANSFLYTHDTIRSTYHYLSLLLGVHFRIKRFYFEVGGGTKNPIAAYNKNTGKTVQAVPGSVSASSYQDEKNRTIEVESSGTAFISLGYDFSFDGWKYGLFLSGQRTLYANINNNNWILAGLRFYPFSKPYAFD